MLLNPISLTTVCHWQIQSRQQCLPSFSRFVLSLQADGMTGGRGPTPTTTCHPQTRPPNPASTFSLLPLLLISQEWPFHLWAWGRGYLGPKASNVATDSKGLLACRTAGRWHLLPPSARFILEASSPTQGSQRNPLSLLSQLPPSSRVRKTIFHKTEKRGLPVLLSVIQAKGAVYGARLCDSCFSLYALEKN